jgi:hypothetical protein
LFNKHGNEEENSEMGRVQMVQGTWVEYHFSKWKTKVFGEAYGPVQERLHFRK